MRKVGIVGSIIGAIITLFGLYNYKNARGFYRALNYFGPSNSASSGIWSDRMDNYKIVLIVGAIILVVSIILLLASPNSSTTNNTQTFSDTNNLSEENVSSKDAYARLSQLESMRKDGLITEEEYQSKKKDILDNM